MDQDQDAAAGRDTSGWTDVAIRLVLVAIIVYWSFLLMRPFIAVLIWTAILSVALYPAYLWLRRVLGGRSTLASFLLTTALIVVILTPVGIIGVELAENLSGIVAGISAGTIAVPPPPPYVAEWPLIGGKLSAFWEAASIELAKTLTSIAPQLKETALTVLGAVGNVGIGVLQFAVAIIIAGFIFSRATGLHETLTKFAVRAAPKMGAGFVELAQGTVRSVARGVVGISLIQSILFGIGAIVAGIPLAGLWTFLAFIFAIVQVGPAVVIIPVIIFAWSSMDTVGAAILTAYMVPVMVMDNFLKPLVMGRGLPVPMLVIFIGVIGGTITHGLVGLFVGPIILALGYELGRTWVAMASASSKS